MVDHFTLWLHSVVDHLQTLRGVCLLNNLFSEGVFQQRQMLFGYDSRLDKDGSYICQQLNI